MSHRKGNVGEREVAHIVQPWWRKLESSADFIRTPLSGGWGKHQGTAIAAHFKACGDLMTSAAQFPFCVEVKWREQWSVDNLLNGKPTPPWEWWRQCIEAANSQDSVPMMWMRKNRMRGSRAAFPWLVWLPADYVAKQRLSTPDIQWSSTLLAGNGVDFGGVLPVVYDYNFFLRMAPHRMRVKATR